jgi:hypothetical protein
VTAAVPRQRSRRERLIDTVRYLVRQGVVGEYHDEIPNRRWAELCRAARALGLRPHDAIYRVRDGIWSDQPAHLTAADFIREAATR